MSATEVQLARLGNQAKAVFVPIWTALWLYFSLGMVLLSFSAIQFQTQIEDDARRGFVLNTNDQPSPNGATLRVTVAQIELSNSHYLRDLQNLQELVRLVDSLDKDGKKSKSDISSRVGDITRSLYPKLFVGVTTVPNDVIAAIIKKCDESALEETNRQQCLAFKDAISESNNTEASTDERDSARNKLESLRSRIDSYENSSLYTEAEEISSYRRMAQLIFPWLPADILLPALPHPILVMIVTLSMGALGSALFMLQLHLVGEGGPTYQASVLWHIFRPLQGMATALAIFLLVKAGQISISHSGGSGLEDTDLNAFVLGFVGVVSGLLSDRAMNRLTAAGITLFRTSDALPGEEENSNPGHDNSVTWRDNKGVDQESSEEHGQ